MIPKAAVDYIKNKKLKAGFSYKDVWHEEHAMGFTVAKAMQLDVLSDMHKAVIAAVEKGQSFESFKKNIKPLLQEKGWWGKKEMVDPLTGQVVNAQLGSDRRLKTIYRVNMRSAFQRERYERTMKSPLHPYMMYRIGPSVHHREEHVGWNGLILPKDDPWWDSHLPPNGFGCKCYTVAVSEARKQRYEKEGVPVPPSIDGTGGGTMQVKTKAPPVKYTTYFNERKGTTEKVPEGVHPAFNWNPGKAQTLAAEQKLAEAKQNYEAAAALKPKKEYLTKKKLEGHIADIEAQMKGVLNKKVITALEAKKAGYQKLLAVKQTKTIVKQKAVLQKKLDGFKVKTYLGIWKEAVTTADWAEKAASVKAKKEYFQSKLKQSGLSAANKATFKGFLEALDEFDAEGKLYHEAQEELKNLQTGLTTVKKSGINETKNVFSRKRKDAAVWAKSTQEADTVLRAKSGEVWRNASLPERKAAYRYTENFGVFNRPLSGYQKPWKESGTGFERKYFKGVDKVWIDYEGAGNKIRAMTDMISRSSYDFDIWLQRGEYNGALEARLGLEQGVLRGMSNEELQQFVGKDFTNYAFTSSAVNKGAGFSDRTVIWNIYAPKGTRMVYAEPFSRYGLGGGKDWDGVSQQAKFGGEAEMIIQRGASYTITKIERDGGRIIMDVEVHPERGYELIQQNPADWKGSKEKFK